MMKAVSFSFVVLTFYVAAMYHSLTLLFVFLAELLLLLCMWILSRYFKRHLTVDFPTKSPLSERNALCLCSCRMINTGKLPVSRIRVRFQMRYQQERKGKTKHLYGISKCGTDTMRFGVRPPYCGIVCLRFDQARTYDYLGIFFDTLRAHDEMKIAVLPTAQALNIEFGSYRWNRSNLGNEKMTRESVTTSNEVRQLHEYREGDLYRHIHWNLSARADKVWIKEYENEADTGVDLLLEIDGAHGKNLKTMDAFYRLLCSIVSGLLQRTKTVRVRWCDGRQKQLAGIDVADIRSCQEMLLDLYKTDFTALNDTQANELLTAYAFACGDYFKLDSQLCWYFDKTIIHQFSVSGLEREMSEKIFTL